MVTNFELSPEQLKTLKLFSYYCGSYGAKTATMYVYIQEYGSVDYMDEQWYSETGTRIEGYDKINDLIQYILTSTSLLDYYEYENSGTLIFEIDVHERKMKVDGYHRESGTNDSTYSWSYEDDIFNRKEDFAELFSMMRGMTGELTFEGGGDSGYLQDKIELYGSEPISVPTFLEDWCYDKLPGGWEINEGSQGRFLINSTDKTIELDYQENVEDEFSDGTVGYVEF